MEHQQQPDKNAETSLSDMYHTKVVFHLKSTSMTLAKGKLQHDTRIYDWFSESDLCIKKDKIRIVTFNQIEINRVPGPKYIDVGADFWVCMCVCVFVWSQWM